MEEDTLELVEYTKWASPKVAVMKQDKQSVRICRETVNPVMKLDRYAIQWVEDHVCLDV